MFVRLKLINMVFILIFTLKQGKNIICVGLIASSIILLKKTQCYLKVFMYVVSIEKY